MFVAEIAGHSMEPRIPDGSLCVFRYGVVGSRNGRLVLAEESRNRRQQSLRREALPERANRTRRNGQARADSAGVAQPEYPSWDLDPDEEKYRILAEFVRVLD